MKLWELLDHLGHEYRMFPGWLQNRICDRFDRWALGDDDEWSQEVDQPEAEEKNPGTSA